MPRSFGALLRRVTRPRIRFSPAARLMATRGPPPADDDFVDLGFLADMTSAPAYGKNQPAGVQHVEEPILGIVRATVDPVGTEYSRFNIPLDAPRGGKPIPRENSRAALAPWDEEALAMAALNAMDEPDCVASSSHLSTTSTARGIKGMANDLRREETDSADEQRDDAPGSALATSRSLPLPDPQTLPYDDEKFADMILEMEVDGAIDDAWQDTRKAHIEDVKEVVEILKSLKVRDICCIDVSAKTGNFDYMLFGTCEGARHIHLAAWAAQEADSLRRVSKIKRKQTDELWEVVPIGRIVLNLMVESLRDELTLERKWAVTASMDPLEAANAPVSEGRQVRAHGLWTLTLNLQDLEDFEVDYCKDILLRQ